MRPGRDESHRPPQSAISRGIGPFPRRLAAAALSLVLLGVLVPASAAAYSSALGSPAPPLASSSFTWSVTGGAPSKRQVISSTTLSGCWSRAQVSSATSTTGSVSIQTTGAIRVSGLGGGSLPLQITVQFASAFT